MRARADKRIYDVTYPIAETLPVWPGDPRVRLLRAAAIKKGAPANLTRLDIGSHTGTHVDAPYHFIDGAPTLDKIPMSRWMGRARVVAIDGPAIGAAQLKAAPLDGARKVLFKTRNSGKLRIPTFVRDFVALEPEGARYLVHRGVDLVGIDYLSIERFGSKKFETHRVLLGSSVLIIEGLDLSRVKPGDYELLCFPLLLKRGDGAPARVVLRDL